VVSMMIISSLIVRPARAGLFKIALPLHFASESCDGSLPVRFDQETKPRFHRRFLGPGAAIPHGLAHQAIINVDICPHKTPSLVMCKIS
jgi:hypothetical protein